MNVLVRHRPTDAHHGEVAVGAAVAEPEFESPSAHVHLTFAQHPGNITLSSPALQMVGSVSKVLKTHGSFLAAEPHRAKMSTHPKPKPRSGKRGGPHRGYAARPVARKRQSS